MNSPTRVAAVARLGTLLALEVAGLWLLVSTGGDRPGRPPLDGSFTRWWTDRDPLDAAAGIGWLIALAAIAYLVAVTSLHLVAVLVRGRRLGRLATALGPRFLLGVAATVSLTAPAALAADGPAASGTGATMEVVEAPRTALPWAPGVVTPSAAPAQTTPPEPPPPPPPTEANRQVVVVRGDNMWSIARAELAARLARRPTNAEVDPYWRQLIELNRDRLVHPDDPGLIYPGQTFDLP
jgi:hypothetical protein